MKLYFYILDTKNFGTGESELRYEECDVIEKPKTYKPKLNGFPKGVYANYVRKEDIGYASGYNRNIVILDSPDTEKAKKILSEQIGYEIDREQKKIDILENKLSAVQSFVG